MTRGLRSEESKKRRRGKEEKKKKSRDVIIKKLKASSLRRRIRGIKTRIRNKRKQQYRKKGELGQCVPILYSVNV